MDKPWVEDHYCEQCYKKLSPYEYYAYRGVCTKCHEKLKSKNE